jgi:hypothetical protein
MEYNISEEIWVPINGYEGHYLVSDFGRIKSIDRHLPMRWASGDRTRFHKGKIKNATPHYKNEYLSVMLKVGGVEDRRFVHRLVAEHFHENPENKPEVNHKDGDKNNNHFLNLEWATALENTQHAIQTGLSKNAMPVIIIKDCAIIEFRSRKECSKYINICNSWIGKAIKNNFPIKGFYIYDL